ncbi:MAG: hypothetical protein JWO81_794 [Alphaproteobacteria bacterium]|nr:hypothetical protein [Alphaproteobacteria bacterium]
MGKGRTSVALLVLLPALLASGEADAAEWRLTTIMDTDKSIGYAVVAVDASTIQRSVPSVRFWEYTIWERPQFGHDSTKTLRSAQCDDHSYEELQVTYYSGQNVGRSGEPRPRAYAVPGTTLFHTIDVACGNAPFLTEGLDDPHEFAQRIFASLHRVHSQPRRSPAPRKKRVHLR